MFSREISSRKTIWYMLSVFGAAVIIMAAVLIVTTGLGHNVSEAKSSVNTVDVKAVKIDDSSRCAARLFSAGVADINDTAKVVELFEAMGLEEAIGEYAVEISPDNGVQALKLTVKTPVQQSDKKTFNRNMKKYAQQMLVLIPQVDKVQWSYTVLASNGSKNDATASVSTESFTKKFGNGPDSFGTSKESVQKMLKKQAGKD